MTTKTISKADLAQFTGSEIWYRHGLVRAVLFTDGAKYVADVGSAYWLLDEIVLAQCYEKRIAAEEFQLWKLTVTDDRTATLTCDDGNGNIVFRSGSKTMRIFRCRKSRSISPTALSCCPANLSYAGAAEGHSLPHVML